MLDDNEGDNGGESEGGEGEVDFVLFDADAGERNDFWSTSAAISRRCTMDPPFDVTSDTASGLPDLAENGSGCSGSCC